MKIEIRSNDSVQISGYVNAVERRSHILRRPGAPPFREIVMPGTFRKAIEKGNTIELRLDHKRILCDTGSGLELREDNVGLYASALVTDAETVKAARNGRLTGWSFGFYCVKDNWREDEGTELRELEDIQLTEVSILTKKPAYIATSIEVRDDDRMKECRCTEDSAETTEIKTDLSVYKAELELLSFGGIKND